MNKSSETSLEKTQNFKDSPTFFSLPSLRIAILIVFILTIFGLIFYFYPVSAESNSLAELNKAFRLERPVHSRISGLNYAPLDNKRGNDFEKTENVDAIALESAKRFAVDAVRNVESAESLQSLSRVYLAEKEFDKAETQLEKAIKLAPQNAEILNDLAVAYLEKSKKLSEKEGGKQLELLAKSLENFEKAIELKPDFAEAVFNKAICLQILSLPNQTAETWQKFLTLDADSKWSDEARQNLELIETNKPQSRSADELLREFMDAFRARNDEKAFEIVSRNREMITGKLIPQRLIWEFLDSQDSHKQEYLDALRYIGNIEKQKTGDAFFNDIAEYYNSVSVSKFPILKNAQAAVKQAYKFTLDGSYDAALTEFEKSQKLFTKAENNWEAEYAAFWIGYILTRKNQIQKSAEVLKNTLVFANHRKYKWLASHSMAWLAYTAGFFNRTSEEIDFNKNALQLAKDVFDTYNQQRILSQLSDNFGDLGQYRQALDYAAQGLKFSISPEASFRQKWRDYNTIARILGKQKFYTIAVAYKKESLFLEFSDSDKNTYHQPTFVDLGLIEGIRGNSAKADEYFGKSYQLAEKITDLSSREKAFAKTDLQFAHTLRLKGDCQKALPFYDKAVNFYITSEFQPYLYNSHKGRLLCYLQEKREIEFYKEFSVISQLFQQYRNEIIEEQNRNSFFDGEQDLYDIAIRYEYDKGNTENAFNFAEESRARSLLDLITKGGKISGDQTTPEIKVVSSVYQPLKLSEIQNQISPDIQIIQYSVLDDKLLIWLITKDSFKAFEVGVSLAEIENNVSLYLNSITRRNENLPQEEMALAVKIYQHLFQPLETSLDPNKKICLIPDKILFQLPFASLIAPGEQFLLQKYKIIYAPSLNIFLICTKKAESFTQNKTENILSIGNPAFNQQNFTELQKLPNAATEAERVADFYERKTVLLEKSASKKNVTAYFETSDVIHFAGHYVVDEYSPLLSKMILADEAGITDIKNKVLMNHEIFERKFVNTKLVVLAACQTGVEGIFKGEGMTGASRVFLAAGIPSIIASQWSVDSEATTQLMIAFHRYRKIEGLSSDDALRRAQIDLITATNGHFRHPFYWAGFFYLGGLSDRIIQ